VALVHRACLSNVSGDGKRRRCTRSNGSGVTRNKPALSRVQDRGWLEYQTGREGTDADAAALRLTAP
jgi:hypothetical protein